MSKYLMGVDVGTTGAKAMVMTPDGKVVSTGYREYECVYPKQDWVEQDAELVVQQTFGACKDAMESGKLNPQDIAGVGFSVQRATFLLIDSDNQVIDGKFYGWQDNRAASEIPFITSKIPAAELYKLAGMPVTPTFSLEKIVWVQNHEPEKFARTKKILLTSDYVMWRFGTDEFYCERTNACCSGMLNVHTLSWSEPILTAFNISPDKLGRLVDPGTVVGSVSAEAAALTGLMEGTPLVTGTGDQQSAAVGAGVSEPGSASLTLGTAGLLVVATAEPVLEDASGFMMVPSSGILGLYELEGIQLGAASSYRWVRDTIADLEKLEAGKQNKDPYTLMEDHINKSAPGSNGVVFLPFLIGAGYPYWNPEAKGAFLGLKFSNTKSDMLRAVMEGVTLESKDMCEKMKANNVQINSLAITGGATRSPAWRQIIADMFDVEVKQLAVGDATIVGVAILAGVGVGIFPDVKSGVQRMVGYTDTVRPNAQEVAVYAKSYEVYTAAYQAFQSSGLFGKLSGLSASR